MACIFYNQFRLRRCAVFVDFLTHPAGNKNIFFSVDKKERRFCPAHFPGGITLIQAVPGIFLIQLICDLDHGKSRKMIHAVQYMGKYILCRGKCTVRDNSLHLGRKFHSSHHADSSASHRISMKKDLGVLADLLDHPFNPLHSVIPIHGTKANICSLTFSVSPLVNQQHPESMFQIIIGKTAVVIQTFAGIAMETDDCLCPSITFEIGAVEFQSVSGTDPYLLMRLFHHPGASLVHNGKILFPVHAGHLHGTFCLGIIAFHGPSVKICGAGCFCRRQNSQKSCCSFQ